MFPRQGGEKWRVLAAAIRQSPPWCPFYKAPSFIAHSSGRWRLAPPASLEVRVNLCAGFPARHTRVSSHWGPGAST